jgi:hypothetical protein
MLLIVRRTVEYLLTYIRTASARRAAASTVETPRKEKKRGLEKHALAIGTTAQSRWTTIVNKPRYCHM